MAAILYDSLAVKELILPIISGAATAQPTISGALFISGAKLYFVMAGTPVLVTSA